ncbi:hypothetical protein CRE_02147 [Caenorhabditis remanei]|uniref:Uncharacterized protein n=2 Tax=Caenorhabditis remanei TaxID=31234 RepID=E3LFB2_CAERE|nr:hypothetical protein CRE_02147 [Caenorhabditis remanei]
MNARNGQKSVQSSASDIIQTFNHFFMNVPSNKSFDMTYKVYISDLADTEDRTTLSAHSSLVNVNGVTPTTITSYGTVPTLTTSTTTLSQPSSIPSAKSSTSSSIIKSSEEVSMRQIEELCADNMARKERSMVNLNELTKELKGFQQPPPRPPQTKSPTTVYENLTTLESSKSSTSSMSAPSTFTNKDREFKKIVASDMEGDDGSLKLFIKVTDCFN